MKEKSEIFQTDMIRRLTDAMMLRIEVDLFSCWLMRAQIVDSQRGPTYSRVKIRAIFEIEGQKWVHFIFGGGRYKLMALDHLGGIRMSLNPASLDTRRRAA